MGDLSVIAYPHALRNDGYRAEVPYGLSIAEIVGGVRSGLYIEIDGEPVPPETWETTRPAAGQRIYIYAVPEGDPASLYYIGQMLIAASAEALTTYLGLEGWVATLTQVALTVAGSLALQGLIAPQEPSGDGGNSSRFSGITAARNRATPYAPLPRLYGTFRYHWPLAGNYVTESSGSDQYLRMLVCLGYGPLKIGGQITGSGYSTITEASGITEGAIQIGGTAIEEYDDFEYEIGAPSGLTLYTQDYTEVDPGATLTVQSDSGSSGWYEDNVSAVRTTAADTDEISIDITFPAGLWTMGKNGELNNNSGDRAKVEYKIEYAPAGTSSWTLVTQTIEERVTQQLFRISKRWQVSRGQYDVRVTRIQTRIYDRENVYTDFQWSALRSIKHAMPWTYDGAVLMALRIKATDQLNGIIDQLSVEAQSVLDVWDGSQWTAQATNNPAWAYADTMRGPQNANPLPDSRINADDLKDWADWCDTNGIEYNWVHDRDETMLQRLRGIAAAGRGSWGVRDGLWTVVRDLDGQDPAMQLSPRNSWNLRVQKVFKDMPHALKVRYIDTTHWQQAERIVYDDGYDEISATKFEVLETQGVTSADQAWKEGRYHLAQARLRPSVYTIDTWVQSLRATRGDLVTLAHDVLLVGLAWGRIKSVTTDAGGDATAVTLDEAVPMESGTTYALRIERFDGTQVLQTVETEPGEQNTLTFTTAVSGVEEGAHAIFGESGAETIDCKITQIRYHADLTASLTLVDAAPGVHLADGGTIPAYDPQITLPPETRRPPAPSIQDLVSDNTTYIQQPDDTYTAAIRAAWRLPPTAITLDRAELRYSSDGGVTYQRARADIDQLSVLLENVTTDTAYTVQARVRSLHGRWSEWSAAKTITTVAADQLPDRFAVIIQPLLQVQGLELVGQANGTEFGGRDAQIQWWPSAVRNAYELGQEPRATGGDSGIKDGWFKDYLIERLDENGEVIGEAQTALTEEFTYTYERNAEDSGSTPPPREFTLQVWCRGKQNQQSDKPARITVKNKAPDLPKGANFVPGFQIITANFVPAPDIDYDGLDVWLSKDSGFTPSDSNRVLHKAKPGDLIGDLATNTTYYIRYASRDAYGIGDVSGEIAVTTKQLEARDMIGVSQLTRDWITDNLDNDSVVGDKVVSLTIAKTTTGILAATESIQCEGLITAVGDGWSATLGPTSVNGKTALFATEDPVNGTVAFASYEDGGVEAGNEALVYDPVTDSMNIVANVTITGGLGIQNLADAGALAAKDSVDLSSGDVTNKTADNIAATASRQWAAEAGADVTGNNTANDTSNVNGIAAGTVQAQAEVGYANRSVTGANVNNWNAYPLVPTGFPFGVGVRLDRTNKFAIPWISGTDPSGGTLNYRIELEVLGATVTGFTNTSFNETFTDAGGPLDFTETTNTYGTNGMVVSESVSNGGSDTGVLQLDSLDESVVVRLKVTSNDRPSETYLGLGDRVIKTGVDAPLETFFAAVDSQDYDVLLMTNAPSEAGADSTQGQLESSVTIASGGIVMSAGGSIIGGQTGYDSGEGFFIGYDGGAYKLSLGDSAGDKITYNGTRLLVTGEIEASSFKTSLSGQRIEINPGDDNEIHFYGDRGDGTVEEVATIGINSNETSDTRSPYTSAVIGYFGSADFDGIPIYGRSNGDHAAVLNADSFAALWMVPKTWEGSAPLGSVYVHMDQSVASCGSSANGLCDRYTYTLRARLGSSWTDIASDYIDIPQVI